MADASIRLLLPDAAPLLGPARAAFFDELVSTLRRIPGVEFVEPALIAPPRFAFQLGLDGPPVGPVPEPRIASVRVTFGPDPSLLPQVGERLAALLSRVAPEVQSDPVLQPALWASGDGFGRQGDALRLIGLAPAHKTAEPPVHVVIVDQGFDRTKVAGPFGGGWYRLPDPTVPGLPVQLPGSGRSPHAAMIARTVRAIAPDAILFDAPLIPTPAPGAPATIDDIGAFTLDAAALWIAILSTIASHPASWVFVNAWSLYDRASEFGPIRYSTDPNHLLNLLIDETVQGQNADVVFAAGNCGQFDPDWRCSHNDRGPCRSIWGANSLASVLTVAAVRTDRTWLGYSSEGRGQPRLGPNKPDLCAPSQFAADDDAAAIHSGTSAAAAVAAGVVAVLRAQRGQDTLSPAALKVVLAQSVLAPMPNDQPYQTGAGMIQLAAAQARL